MNKFNEYVNGYKLKLEKLIICCDGLEEDNNWNLEEFVEMDSYLINELMSVVLPLIAVDGKISEREVEYVNRIFGTEYSLPDLRVICMDVEDVDYKEIDERIRETSELLKVINKELEESYRDMYVALCELIEVSDLNLSVEEEDFLVSLKETMNTL